MSITFFEVVIMNQNSIEIDVTLEVPSGTFLSSTTIAHNSSKSISVNKQDIQTAKIIVESKPHDDYADKMEFDFTNSGKPYKVCINKIEAKTSIGSLHGIATIQF